MGGSKVWLESWPAKSSSSEEVREIRRLHDQMAAHYARGDYPSHFEANEQIHPRIRAGSKNRNLMQLLRSVSSRVAQAHNYVILSDPQRANAMAEHEAIIAALEARDGPLLSRLLNEHMRSTFQAISAALTAPANEQTPGGSRQSSSFFSCLRMRRVGVDGRSALREL